MKIDGEITEKNISVRTPWRILVGLFGKTFTNLVQKLWNNPLGITLEALL